MRIEVAREGRMDMSGQGLLRAIQNDNMPLLDLFVRESVQNSLDAGNIDQEYVRVDFGTGTFVSSELADELEGITQSLNDRYENDICEYVFVRDTNTEGLTGPMHFSDIGSGANRNLLKLVYEIAKPQENKGSGGSWGYGKTIYFRVGIGLVLYYSRIIDEEGSFQSRLAACLVEDEKNDEALLNNSALKSKRGLAWWGESFEYRSGNSYEKGTVPITDEDEIGRILGIFGVEKYCGDETGTTVIIPYIDEERLLRNNISEEVKNVPWLSNIGDYLRIAVERWYIGRLNNPDYTRIHEQPWLKVSINGIGISSQDMEEPFAIIQELYNLALNGEERDDEYHCEPIPIRKFFESTTSGYIAYKMCSPEEMGMKAPTNNPSPFVFLKNEEGADDYKDGDIILTYFRKPGMAVTYDTAGEWVNKIKCNNEKTGNVLFAVFVLNSGNRFSVHQDIELETIEDYFRSSERADHTSWYDINVNETYPRILDKIQKGIRKRINETYVEEQETAEVESSSLSKMFGEFFLPPKGFGKKAGRAGKRSKLGVSVTKHKELAVAVRDKEISIDGSIMTVPIEITSGRPLNKMRFTLDVSADGKNIPLQQWTDKLGIDIPFGIDAIHIHTVQSDKRVVEKDLHISDRFAKSQLDVEILRNEDNDAYGFTVDSDYENLIITMEMIIQINDFASEMKYQIKEGE